MVTTTLPLSEYSSVYRPAAGGGGTSSAGIAANSDATKNPVSPIQARAKNSETPKEKLNFLDNFISFKKSAALKEEHFLLFGLFNDVLKTTAKVLTGSFLTDVLKSLLKDANQTFETIIYKTLMDSGPSRIVNDVANAFAVRLFNGNHSLFGLLRLPFVAPEISSQICPQFLIPLMRGATRKHNPNAESANKNKSPKMRLIKAEIENRNRMFYRFAKTTSQFFDTRIKPVLDRFFKTALGVEVGQPLLDKENNPIPVLDKQGKNKLNDDGTIKVKTANPQVNKLWLGGIMAGSFIGSFFLPKFTQASGFEKVKSPLRAVLSVITTSLFRLRSTITHNGFGMHIEGGSNFDQCFKTSVREKMLVPMVQYSADSLASLISHKTKFINGAVLSNILRVLLEVPAVFVSVPSIQVAAEDRVNDEWKFLSYKIWKPASDFIESITRPFFEGLYRIEGTLWGMFDPEIPHMYGEDIDNNKDELEPEIDKKFSSNPFSIAALFMKKCAQIIYKDTPELLRSCAAHTLDIEKEEQKIVNEANKNIDIRVSAEKALQEKGIAENLIKLENKDVERNEKILELSSASKSPQELIDYLNLANNQSKAATEPKDRKKQLSDLSKAEPRKNLSTEKDLALVS